MPALASARRLSKVFIVNESIRHLRQQRAMCIAAAQDMQELLAENSRLASELNALCSQPGESGIPLSKARPLTEAMVQLMNVPNEVYGKFPAGFGDNGACDSITFQPNSDRTSGEDEEARLSLRGSFSTAEQPYHTQPPATNEPNTLCTEPPRAIPASQRLAHGSWDLNSTFDGQVDTPFIWGPDLFALETASMEGYMLEDMPDDLSEPLPTTLHANLQHSWT